MCFGGGLSGVLVARMGGVAVARAGGDVQSARGVIVYSSISVCWLRASEGLVVLVGFYLLSRY